MARKKQRINKVRASRDGHEFHEAWTARQALHLVFPSDDLVGIAVEGPSPTDEQGASAASMEVADLVLFYGKRPDFVAARKVDVLQFKYSIRNKQKPVRISDAKETISKFANSYSDHKRRYGARKVAQNLSFEFVTNRPIDDALRDAIASIATGARLSKKATDQADQFKTASGLNGKELVEFAGKVRFVGLTGDLKDSKSDLSRTLADWSASSTDALAHARLGQLRDLVRNKAGSAGSGRNVIVRTDVFAALGVSGIEELLPCPESFPKVGKVVEREQLVEALARLEKAKKPFLVHAEGGIGKTVFLQSLASSLSGSHKTILFDCFGGGGYRAPEEARHLPRKGLVHIANLLATESLCDPLLPGHDNSDEIIRHFRKRLTQAVKTLQRRSSKTQLLIFLDAIDNAAIQAKDRNEDSFPQRLLESFRRTGPVDGVRLIVSCRTERRELAKGNIPCEELALLPFSRNEASQYLRARVKKATNTEINVAFARSQGNPRILEHLAEGDQGLLEESEIDKKIVLDELLAGRIESALEDASKHGYSDKTIRTFLAGLAVLPPPVPINEYANAQGISAPAIQSFAADLYPLLEKTKHGLVFRDEPTETYVRNNYAADTTTLRRVADNLFKKQGQSVYAASALPGLLQKLDDGDLLFKLAMDTRFPAAITSDVGKREIRYSRLKAASHFAARQDDFDQLVHLLVEMSTIAAVNQRGESYLRDNPDLVVASGDVDAMRRLFEMRTPWPGTRHARLAIANVLYNDVDEAQRHVVNAVDWINHAWRQERKPQDERRGPESLDLASVPLCQIVQGRPKVAARVLGRLTDWAAFEVAQIVFSLLQQALRASAIGQAHIDEFQSALKSEIGVLASALSSADLRTPLRRSHVRKLAAACRRKKKISRKESLSSRSSDDIDDGLEESSALAIFLGLRKEALDILAVVPSTRPGSWTYTDRFPDGSSKSFILRSVLRAVAMKQPITEQDLLPKELAEICKSLPTSLSGEAFRKAAFAQLETQFKAQPPSEDDKKAISYDEKRRMEEFLNRRSERLLRVAQALERVLSRGVGNADKAFLALLDVWTELAKSEDEYTNRQKGRLFFDLLGSGLAIFCLRVRDDLKPASVRAAIAAFVSSKSTAFVLFDAISILAKRPRWHGCIDVAASKARSLIEHEDDVGQRGSMFGSLAKAILPASKDEAAAYFQIGLKEMDAIGSEDYFYTNELLLFAASLKGAELDEQDFHTLSNVCEMNMAYEAQKFPWFAFGRGMAAAAGPRMLAKLGRWDDRDKISLEYTLLSFLTALIERRKITPEVALGLMQLTDPAELYVCGTGTFATALHANGYQNERTLLQELIRQFFENNPGLPSRSATEELRSLAREVLGVNSYEAVHLSAAAPRYSALIDEQSKNRNYHGADERIGKRKDNPEKEKQKKRKALAAIAARTNPVDEASMVRAIVAFNKIDYAYDVKDEFFDALRAQVAFADRSKYVRIVAGLDGFYVYWKLQELEQCRNAWAGTTAALAQTFRDLAVPLIQVHFEKFIRDDSLSGAMLKDISDFTGVSFAHVAVELVKTLSRSDANYAAAVWMALAAIINEQAKPGEAQSALNRLLSGPAVRLAAGVTDGAWRSELYPEDNETELAAGLVWLKLGSPSADDRWRAAHAIRCFARLGRSDVIDAVVARFESTSAKEFQAPELKFYHLHARLWLLIALARLALDEPTIVAKYQDRLLAIIKDGRQPHVLMRHFAAEALRACNRAGKVSLAASDVVLVGTLNSSPFERIKYSSQRPHAHQGDRPRGAPKPANRFGLEYDFEKYDVVNLADVFARPAWEASDAIADWVRKFDASVRSMHENGGRTAPGSRGIGLVSHYHIYGQYLGWTCICFAAANLLAKYPVHDAYFSYEEDAWTEWLGRRRLTRTDGLWLSDGIDPTPLETQVNLLEQDRDGLVLTGDKIKLLQLAGINGAELGKELVVEGNWKSSDGIDVSVSSALVAAASAKRFASKLAKTKPFHAWLPTLEPSGSTEEYQRNEKDDCEAWIVTPSPETRLDDDDPLGAPSAMRRPYFKKEVNARESMVSGDPFNRRWVGPTGTVVAHAEAWGREFKYRENGSQTGQRLACTSEFLARVLAAKKASLVLLINIQRYKEDTRSTEGHFTNSSAVVVVTSKLKLTYFAGPTNSKV